MEKFMLSGLEDRQGHSSRRQPEPSQRSGDRNNSVPSIQDGSENKPKATKASGGPKSPGKVTEDKKATSARARIPRAAKIAAVKKAAEPTVTFTVKAAKKKTAKRPAVAKNLTLAKIPAARKPAGEAPASREPAFKHESLKCIPRNLKKAAPQEARIPAASKPDTKAPASRYPAEKHFGPIGNSKKAAPKKAAAAKSTKSTKNTAKTIGKQSTSTSKAGRPKKAAAATSSKFTGKKTAGRPKKAAPPPTTVDDRDTSDPSSWEGEIDGGGNFIPFGGVGIFERLSGRVFTSPPNSGLFGERAKTPTSTKKSPARSPGKGSPGKPSPGKGSPGKASTSPKKSPKKV